MDPLACRLVNRLLGNAEDAAGLELTVSGPTLRFNHACVFALGGAPLPATLEIEGKAAEVRFWTALEAPAGAILRLGAIPGPAGAGMRAYLGFRQGLDVPVYMGSRSTFTLGGFGGHGGRALRTGDVLRLRPGPDSAPAWRRLPDGLMPRYGRAWTLGVLYGPHGAPDYFRDSDIAAFFSAEWEVHDNSNRTGVRLIGPKPESARPDGGEAGLHPSNIHDNAYAVGAVDFTGDMPILLGPDGPSLGGFVFPATVVQAELWKPGHLTISSSSAASTAWTAWTTCCASSSKRATW